MGKVWEKGMGRRDWRGSGEWWPGLRVKSPFERGDGGR